ncbi:MAG: DsbA family protein [Rhodospirillales bacterium]|nr:DsbA family protein [Rhodospirillales bacterium]
MKRYISFLLLGFLALAGAAMVPQLALAQGTTPDAKALAPRQDGDDMVIGLAGAPVTIIEYASLTCPHCANFHANTYPQLKSNYIDKGLVKLVYRDFPLDRIALSGSMLARCAGGPDRYFAFLDALYKQQGSWARGNANDMLTNLRRIARLGGMSEPAIDACLKDENVQKAVLTQSLQGEREFGVNSTPTLIINGKKQAGALTFDELDKVLKPLVAR